MRRIVLPLAVLLALASSGCSDDDDPEGAADLWQRINVANYPTWQRPVNYTVRKASFTAHSAFVDIFMNDAMAQTAATHGTPAWPIGSVIVTNQYDHADDPDESAVAAMEKRERGWFYAEWRYDGKVRSSGTPSGCTDCHERSKFDGTWSVGLVR
jgi:hypothetical protein